MKEVTREITKEEYEKALKEGADSLIDGYLFISYGVYSSRVIERDGHYYLEYRRGDSCD